MKWVTALFCKGLLTFSLLFIPGCNESDPDPEDSNSKWISAIVEYRPAPGQFINTSLGNPNAAGSLIGGKGLVSLGGYGGYIIFEFDHAVRNIEGVDFVIFGNAFDGNSEPGIVMVSPDGTSWYELKGSEYSKPGTQKNYEITYSRPLQTERSQTVAWTDNQSGTGQVDIVTAHTQCYYPLFLPGNPATLTFAGTLLSPNSVFEDNRFKQQPYDWGYADNLSEDYQQVVGNDSDTKMSNKFDISNAVDADGQPVVLETIRRIKVYTAVNQNVAGGVGETSTEICGALSLSANR